MRSFFSSLLSAGRDSSHRIEIRIHRQDTILYQTCITATHSFYMGRSLRNGFAIDTPSLPIERFPLLQCRAKQMFLQVTPEMRGTIVQDFQVISLDDVRNATDTETTLYGSRIPFQQGDSVNLFFDGIFVRLQWTSQPSSSPWDTNIPLTPSQTSLPMAV